MVSYGFDKDTSGLYKFLGMIGPIPFMPEIFVIHYGPHHVPPLLQIQIQIQIQPSLLTLSCRPLIIALMTNQFKVIHMQEPGTLSSIH